MSPTELHDSRLLLIVLVVALLSCHGASGALHQALHQSFAVPVVEHPSPAEQGTVPGHHSAGHTGASECGYALAVNIFGVAFALLLLGGWALRRTRTLPRATWNLPAAGAALPTPRGAPFPFLQVFRL